MKSSLITTTYVDDELYTATNQHGHHMTIDMREGDRKAYLNPPEMLLAALAGCVVVDIVSILRKKRKNVIDIKVETVGDRKDDHPRGFKKFYSKYILTSDNVSEEELMKVSRLAMDKYCTVADSLAAPIDLSVEVINP